MQPAPPSLSTGNLNRKSLSFTRHNRSNQFRRTRTHRTRSQIAQKSSTSFEATGTDKEDSDSETTGHKGKKARIEKQNSELDILIEKVSARLKRERSSNSSVHEHGGSVTAGCSYTSDTIPQQPQQRQPQQAPQKSIPKQSQNQNQHQNIPNNNSTNTATHLGVRKLPPSQGPNQRFKPPQRVTNTSFPPQAQQRPNANENKVSTVSRASIKREPSIEAKPTILDVDVHSSSASQSQLQRQPSQLQRSGPPPNVSSDGADYSCDDFDMDILEEVCAQFD